MNFPTTAMRFILFLSPLLLLPSCRPAESVAAITELPSTLADARPAPVDFNSHVIRLTATQQSWSPGQPWEKNPPSQRRALAAIIGDQLVLTTAEMVADATYLEFESTDGTRFAPAKVLAVDYEVNLALLKPADEEEGKLLFANSRPLEVASPPALGETVEMLQVEGNGVPLLTSGILQTVDVTTNFLPGQSFLTFRVKASMQSVASSYSLPVLHGGKLAGLLISYNAKDQICDVASTGIVARFIEEAADGEYAGFPSLGISISRTEDTSFRQWLRLGDEVGGIYVNKVRKGMAAEEAGLKEGDVILAVDGNAIDRRGYYSHPLYGNLFWGHLVRGEKATGESVALSVLRDGEPLELVATLSRGEVETRLVPDYTFDTAPNFLVKGGFVFQELTRPLLEAFGEEWTSRAPLNLLDAYENQEKYEEDADRIVFLSGSIATPATIGYERLRNLIVRRVNGEPIRDMKTLIKAFAGNVGQLHSIEFAEEDFTVYLDDAVATEVDTQLIQRGLTRLSRAD